MSSRPATTADLSELLDIDARCFDRPWTRAAWESELEHPSGFVCLTPGFGFACAPMLVDSCELRRIAVVPSARRSGLGRDLLTAVIAHARSSGAERIELEVAAANLAAIALYRGAGFIEVGRRPRYYSAPPDDAVLMTLELSKRS